MDKEIKQILNADKYRPNNKIFVGNLNPESQDDELHLNFERFGSIKLMDRKKSKEYMIIEYDDHESAQKAVQEMDKIVIDDCEIKVQLAW